MMTPEVTTAIEEVQRAFPDAAVMAAQDGSGGAHVTVEPLTLAGPWAQTETWVKFHVTFQYPSADVYPHFVRPDLSRADGGALGEGLQPSNFHGEPGIQISRRSNKLDPTIDTAALKLLKVLEWLRTRS